MLFCYLRAGHKCHHCDVTKFTRLRKLENNSVALIAAVQLTTSEKALITGMRKCLTIQQEQVETKDTKIQSGL